MSAAFLRDSHGSRAASIDATSLGAGGAAAIRWCTTWQGRDDTAEAQRSKESSLDRGMHFVEVSESCLKRK